MNKYIFVLIVFTQLFVAKNSLADVTIGYGKMEVNKIFVANNPSPSSPPEAFSGEKWNTLILGFASSLSSSNTGITLDLLLSESKKLEDLGSRALVGGGTTRVSSAVTHVGAFIGLRYRLIKNLILVGGYGIMDQEIEYKYSANVSNGGGGGATETFHGSYLGAELEIAHGIQLGIRNYKFNAGVKLVTVTMTF